MVKMAKVRGKQLAAWCLVAAALLVWLGLLGFAVTNWYFRPQAPELHHGETAFQSDTERIRFDVPADWVECARASLPRGPLPRELPLVKYKHPAENNTAMLRVTIANAPPEKTPAQCLEQRLPEDEWRLMSGPEVLEVAGAPAARAVWAGQGTEKDVVREVVAVRRGTRIFYFTATCLGNDDTSRTQMRRAWKSVTWLK
jgi:hypothetical protein